MLGYLLSRGHDAAWGCKAEGGVPGLVARSARPLQTHPPARARLPPAPGIALQSTIAADEQQDKIGRLQSLSSSNFFK